MVSPAVDQLPHDGSIELVRVGARDRLVAPDLHVAPRQEPLEEALEEVPRRLADVLGVVQDEVELAFESGRLDAGSRRPPLASTYWAWSCHWCVRVKSVRVPSSTTSDA